MATVATPIYYRLIVNRGANLQLSGIYKDEQDNPIDLTGCNCFFAIAPTNQDLVEYFAGESGANVLYVTDSETGFISLGGAEGTFVLDVDWQELVGLDPTGEGRDYEQYWWWFLLEYADQDRELLFYGPCEVI